MFFRLSTCTASNPELWIDSPGIWKAPWQRTPVLKPKLALGAASATIAHATVNPMTTRILVIDAIYTTNRECSPQGTTRGFGPVKPQRGPLPPVTGSCAEARRPQRTVDLLRLLRDELAALAVTRRSENLDRFVFATSSGRHGTASNYGGACSSQPLSGQITAWRRAVDPLPERLTLHSLRRTLASLLYALDQTPPRVMAQMGHTSPHLALAIYAREMDRRDGEPERLKSLVSGENWASTGTTKEIVTAEGVEKLAA